MSDAVVSGSVDKRQKIKKDQAAEHRRKYDSRRIYLGNSWDEWERQRAIFGKSHSLFAAHLLERQAAGAVLKRGPHAPRTASRTA